METPLTAPDTSCMDDKPSTAEQHQQIRQTAQERVSFFLWIADKLEKTPDILIRREAAKAIRELLS